MVKQFSILILLSALGVAFMTQYGFVLHGLEQAHSVLAHKLSAVFAVGKTGQFIRNTVILAVLPILVALIPAGAYYAVKRQILPVTPHIVWISWLILVTLLALNPGTSASVPV